MSKTNPHDGSDFDDFLKAEGIYEEVTAGASDYLLDGLCGNPNRGTMLWRDHCL